MQHAYFGDISLDDGFAELTPIDASEGEIIVEIDAAERSPSTEELDGLAESCKNHRDWAAKVIARTTDQYDGLLKDALEVWSEDDKDFLKNFNPGANSIDDVSAQQVAGNLKLAEIRLEIGEPSMIALDFRFNLAFEMDYLVCGRFHCDGSLDKVALES